MKVGFVVDPLQTLHKTKDTSMLLMQYACVSKFEVYCFDSYDLYHCTEVRARAKRVEINLSNDPQFNVLYFEDIAVNDLDLCFIRKDPPVDEHYVTMLQLLSIVEDLPNSPFWVNSPQALLRANEKLYGLRLSHLFPPSCIGCSPKQILDFQSQLDATLVVKPVNEFSSRGIYILQSHDPNRSAILQQMTAAGRDYVIAQKYLEKVVLGDKRVFFVDGEIQGVISRIPREGEFRCALGLGARVELRELSEQEQVICDELTELFKSDGMFFVGIDIIDGYLIEVNVTSPTVVRQYCELSGNALDAKIYEKILEKI
tara:strand:+ start:904 stop:1845 length:942 start_codon:yes stop_codon:yes gene_type:complete